MATLSLCMIVKNEEKNLPECLRAVREAVDEIIIVDTGSTDNTVNIAKQFGAKIYHFEWCDDFSAARNESLRHATSDYIVYLDADDRLEREDVEKLISYKKIFSPDKNEVYYFKLVNVYANGRKESCYQLRIFPNLKELRFKGRVHEQIGPAVKNLGLENKFTDICLYHIGYKDPSVNRLKVERNLKLLLKDLEEEPNFYIYYYLGQSYLYLGNLQRAKEEFSKVVVPKAKEECPWIYITSGIQLSNIYLKEGNLGSSINLLEKMQDELPNNDVIRLFLGQDYLRAGRPQDALNTLLMVNPEKLSLLFVPISEREYKAAYYLNLAEACAQLKYPKLAEGNYERALEFMPENFDLLVEIGNFNLKLGQKQKAVKYFKRALNLSANMHKKSQMYTLLGVIALQEKEISQAERYFSKALEIHPLNTRAAIHLAELKVNQNQLIQAESILKRTLSESKNGFCLHIMSMLALVYAKQARIEECVQVADQILKKLQLPRSLVLEKLSDLADIYLNIAENFKVLTKEVEADLAFKTAHALYNIVMATERFSDLADISK